MRPREWNSQKSNYSLPEIDVISASRSLEIALESCSIKEKRKLVELWLQKWNSQNIKFSVAKMDIIGAPLSLQKASECCAIKGLRKTSIWKEKKNWEPAQLSVSPPRRRDGEEERTPSTVGSVEDVYMLE